MAQRIEDKEVSYFQSYLEKIIGNNYSNINFLTSGGLCDVFTCEREGNIYVVKVVRDTVLKNEETFRRQQALINKQISGFPTIVDMYESSKHTFPFVIQQYIEGPTLFSILEGNTHPPFSNNKVLDYTLQMLETIDWFHKEQILIRDINPKQIIIVENDNRPYLVDSSAILPAIDKERSSYSFYGTLGCFAPEEMEGKSSYKTDLYHLGLVLMAMYSFQNIDNIPRDASTKLFNYKKNMFPEKRDEAIEAIIDRLLQAEPDKRYRDAQEVINIIEVVKQKKSNIPAIYRELPKSIEDFIPVWLDKSFYIDELEVEPKKSSDVPRHYAFFYKPDTHSITEFFLEKDRLIIYNVKRGISPSEFIEVRKEYVKIIGYLGENPQGMAAGPGSLISLFTGIGGLMALSDPSPLEYVLLPISIISGGLAGFVEYKIARTKVAIYHKKLKNMINDRTILLIKQEGFSQYDDNRTPIPKKNIAHYIKLGAPILIDKI